MLDRAICDALDIDHHAADQAGALEWFASDDNQLGSFVWLCDQLALDQDAIRAALARRGEIIRHQLRRRWRRYDAT